MTTLAEQCREIALHAKAAARLLVTASTTSKNAWLTSCASVVRLAEAELLAANALDVAEAPGYGLSAASIDRLTLTPKRIAAMAEGLLQVAALPDPIGKVREGHTRPNGLQVLKVGVPLGVIFFLYESRPNVTIDAAALCVKSGNAVILRGGKEARHTNAALYRLLQQELPKFDLPSDAVQLVSTSDRDAVGHFLKMDDCIDLTIPRGGESLIRRVCAEATMPVLKHFNGNCHIYVDESAEFEQAVAIIINAKCQRPGVCNAVETILLHQRWADQHWTALATALGAAGVELRACDASRRLYPQAKPATDEDYATEYLDLILAVKMVSGVQEAMDHIHRFGSKHTDAILTKDMATARRFTQQVDSAAVVVNASTRFNDGFELGLGAEIGISTDKFHARGPCGLKELTTYKYILTGDGHVRL
jgi:glutamate-5-semialdehyde dehydrogenase